MKPGDLILLCDRRTDSVREIWYIERIREWQSSPNEWVTKTKKHTYIYYYNITKGRSDSISEKVFEIFQKDAKKSSEYLELVES